jgi:hypothetical protein
MQQNTACLMHATVYGPFFMGMTKKDAFASSKMAHPLITLKKCVQTTWTPVSQVCELVEQQR